MSSTFLITVEPPTIPADNVIKHISTDWEFSSFPDFTKRDSIILSETESPMLTSHECDTTNLNKPLYCRIRFNFKNSGTLETYSSDWSKVIIVRTDQQPMEELTILISSPRIKTEITGSNVVVTIEPMKLFTGEATHLSTSWEISDAFGNNVYTNYASTTDLLSLTIPLSDFNPKATYIIKARYNSDKNVSSNYVFMMFKTDVDYYNLFDVEMLGKLMPNRTLYFTLEEYGIEIDSVDVTISDEDDTIVYECIDVDDRNKILIDVGDLALHKKYTVRARALLKSGEYSSYRTIYTGHPAENTIIPMDQYSSYLDTYLYTGEIDVNTMTAQSTIELPNGNILLANHFDTNVYIYKFYRNRLTKIKKAFTLAGTSTAMQKQYVNIIPLTDGRILVDYLAITEVHTGSPIMPDNITTDDRVTVIADGKNLIKYAPRFLLLDYNPVSETFTKIFDVEREDEIYSTSITNSVAIVGDDIYYIPCHKFTAYPPEQLSSGQSFPYIERFVNVDLNRGFEVKVSQVNPNIEYLDLSIRKLNLTTQQITEVADLPVTDLKSFVNLNYLDDDTLLMAGGSTIPYYDSGNEVIHTRINNDVYTYTISTNTFTKTDRIDPLDVSEKVYAFQAQIRKDGHIAYFNAVDSGAELGHQNILVYNRYQSKVFRYVNILSNKIPYRNTVLLNSGSMLRISTTSASPQLSYMYGAMDFNNLYSEQHTSEFNGGPAGYDGLIVDHNTTVFSDRKYTSMVFYPEETLTVLRGGSGYSDLIVDVNKTIADGGQYNSVLFYDHNVLTVTATEPNYVDLIVNTDTHMEALTEYKSIIFYPGEVLTVTNRRNIYNALSINEDYTVYEANEYSSMTFYPDDTLTIVPGPIDVSNLVVQEGESELIENPYRFDSVEVEGTNYDNTGTLEWTTPGGVTYQFQYRDLFVTHDTTIEGTDTFDSITLLEDTDLTVN